MRSRTSRDLVDIASCLPYAAEKGAPLQPLRGKHLGLLSESDRGEQAELFYRAVVKLGAHVSHIKPTLSADSAPADVQRTAQLLGRLYDGVECQGLSEELVQQLAKDAGIPFFHGLASPTHPTAPLSISLSGNASTDEKRCLIVQAVLLDCIG